MTPAVHPHAATRLGRALGSARRGERDPAAGPANVAALPLGSAGRSARFAALGREGVSRSLAPAVYPHGRCLGRTPH